MKTVVREAEASDVAIVAELSSQTFIETFGSQNRPEDMQAYVDQHFQPERIAADLDAPRTRHYIAYSDGRPAGYAKLSWGRGRTPVPDCVGSTSAAQLERLYVLAQHQGGGLGGLLMRRCMIEADSRGSEAMWLGVWEHNQRAIEFYQHFGWSESGRIPFQLGADQQTDVVMTYTIPQ